jgi:hypothetical protein
MADGANRLSDDSRPTCCTASRSIFRISTRPRPVRSKAAESGGVMALTRTLFASVRPISSKMKHPYPCSVGDSIRATNGVKLLKQRCDVILCRVR